jgi:hypothetical protein
MSPETTRTIANALIVAASAAIVYAVVRRPPLRRVAWALLRTAATSAVPALLAREVRGAWEASGHRP